MKHLSPPTDENEQPYSAVDVYETCVSMVRNLALREQLQSIRQIVDVAAADYDAKAGIAELYLRHPHDEVGTIAGNEIVKVYTGRMAKKGSRGRPIYDKIMSAPENRRCPLCGIGTVNTLDHHLPKQEFPVFSVTPNNLVPVCQWCQSEKSTYFATTIGEQLLHPYFDNVDNDIWLEAEVVVDTPVGFRFFASPPGHWTQPEKDRVETHLRKLNLPFLFSSNAGSRLSEIRVHLSRLHQTGGPDSVRAHLLEELNSFDTVYRNSWTSAMYRAAVSNDWFCNGGFLEG